MANNVLIDNGNRLLFFSDDINEETISKISFQLILLLMKDDKQEKEQKEYKREPIHLFINSHGGNNCDMWSLIDIILNSKTPIYTYCTGYAMSAGFLIFLAGEKRFATEHTVFLYHQLSAWKNEKYQNLIEFQQELDNEQFEIENFVSKRTNITKIKLEEIRLHKKDWYIHSNEAVELGIITDLIKEDV